MKQYSGYRELCLLYDGFLDNGVTKHVRICACVIVQFAQRCNLLALFTIALRIYNLAGMVIFIVQAKAELYFSD